MDIVVASRGMKANDILDMAFDMGLERPKIATAGEWDGGRIHILTYGPLSNRKPLEIHAPAMKEHVERLLREVLVEKISAPPIVEAPVVPLSYNIASADEAPKPKPARKKKEVHA